jgi:hypothetical protein
MPSKADIFGSDIEILYLYIPRIYNYKMDVYGDMPPQLIRFKRHSAPVGGVPTIPPDAVHHRLDGEYALPRSQYTNITRLVDKAVRGRDGGLPKRSTPDMRTSCSDQGRIHVMRDIMKPLCGNTRSIVISDTIGVGYMTLPGNSSSDSYDNRLLIGAFNNLSKLRNIADIQLYDLYISDRCTFISAFISTILYQKIGGCVCMEIGVGLTRNLVDILYIASSIYTGISIISKNKRCYVMMSGMLILPTDRFIKRLLVLYSIPDRLICDAPSFFMDKLNEVCVMIECKQKAGSSPTERSRQLPIYTDPLTRIVSRSTEPIFPD